MAELAERMAQVMKDEAKLNSAVTRLMQKKSTPKLPDTSTGENAGPLLRER
jgi:hypothetical protein